LNFVKQRKNGCSVAAVRNCLLYLGYEFSDKAIRDLINTDEKNGTDDDDIVDGLKEINFVSKRYSLTSRNEFKKIIDRELKKKNPIILTTDFALHHVALIEIKGKKYKVVDSHFKNLKEYLDFNQLDSLSSSFNKEKLKTEYHLIVIERI
jgi:ABC-type bacteriocin/lantibiotic exporter with double-glycine peptidase domain